jgi:hypothetical protein
MNPSRAHARQYTRRVNRALELLQSGEAAADAARQLAHEYDVSERQGWRYVREASGRSEPLEVGERKIVFTVKLPESLVQRIRTAAAARGKTQSGVVSEALEGLLGRWRGERPGGGEEDRA